MQQIPKYRDTGLPRLGFLLLDTILKYGKPVAVRCDYCGKTSGPFFCISVGCSIVPTPFATDIHHLYVSHCQECML